MKPSISSPNQVRFSVIIPIFNKAPYVKKALESVFSQTFRDFEIVIVDDGSTDNSLSVAQEVLDGCEVLHHLIHQDNAGVSTARNNAVKASHGDYLCFLDADDWWAPTFLERMDALIRAYPDAGIYGTNYYYVKNGIERICVKGVETGYINYCKVYADGLRMPLWTGAVCLSREVFDEMGGFRPHLKLGEDFDLWIKIVLKYKVAFLNEPHSYYYQDSDPVWRGVGHLVNPHSHMLWNLDYLEEEERTNADYKALIDRLRTYSLLPYLLSDRYREEARQELDKVDWEKQSRKTRSLYSKPVWFIRLRNRVLGKGARVKQWIIRHL